MAFQQYDPITIQDVKDELDKKLASASLLDKVYPVGSIYMSTTNTSPASFLGGEWEPLKNKFLVGAGDTYKVNATGGASSHAHTTGGHTLTADELPKHTHGEAGGHAHTRGSMNITGEWYDIDIGNSVSIWSGNFSGALYASRSKTGRDGQPQSNHSGKLNGIGFDASKGWNDGTTSWNGAHTHSEVGKGYSHSHGDTGSSSSLPPYLAVYMWKRTA